MRTILIIDNYIILILLLDKLSKTNVLTVSVTEIYYDKPFIYFNSIRKEERTPLVDYLEEKRVETEIFI